MNVMKAQILIRMMRMIPVGKTCCRNWRHPVRPRGMRKKTNFPPLSQHVFMFLA